MVSHTGAFTSSGIISKLTFLLNAAEHGALPTLYAATQDVPGGSCIGPDGIGNVKGYPQCRVDRA